MCHTVYNIIMDMLHLLLYNSGIVLISVSLRRIMNKIDCLVIDDERDLADSIEEYFGVFDLSVDCSYNISDAEQLMINNSYSIVLLDLNLPDGSGYELCKKMRNSPNNIPIFFISARVNDDDIIRAYGIGADDYITKPFSLSVLYAKVKAKLNRVKIGTDISLIDSALTVTVGNIEVELKLMECKLLRYFMDNANIVLTKEQLFDNVWQGTYSENTLNVHIKRLRDKIEKDSNNPTRIITIWGVGYKYNDKA